ncbi:hypothetical protein D3C76_738000 [compost metagenome]
MAWTTRNTRNPSSSVVSRQPAAPMIETAIPAKSRRLRPIVSESGPITSWERERPMANRLMDSAMLEGVVWKCFASAGKEGSKTSRGKTPSNTIVINRTTAARRFFALTAYFSSFINKPCLGEQLPIGRQVKEPSLFQCLKCGAGTRSDAKKTSVLVRHTSNNLCN